MHKKLQFGIICNPENRRCQFFKEAVISQGFKMPIVISYLELLQKRIDLSFIFSKIDVLKIESFGENFEVKKELLNLASHKDILNLEFDKGRIRYSKALYSAFSKLLFQIQNHLDLFPNIQLMNSVADILLMFDKTRSHQFFSQKNVPTIPAIYGVKDFDDLITQIKKRNWTRVFIKPNHGSSASGVIAFRSNSQKFQAITSVELVEENSQIKLYNSLKVRTYNQISDIKKIINTLAQDEFIVEKWIPKANTNQGVFDFRMYVSNGKVKHTIARQSRSPMTNLHLGNQRGGLEIIQSKIGKECWYQLCQLAQKAAQTMPQSLYAGLDILLSNSHEKQYLIEANAFGDLLPNIFVDGLSTYESQIHHFKLLENA